MNQSIKDRETNRNGAQMSRKQLLAALERSVKRDRKMTAREGFDALVTAGIVTKRGKLSSRYGG